MSPVFVLVLALSAAVALAGVIGSRINRRLAVRFSELLEAALKPTTVTYTNIGGFVGYHFHYETGPPLGTIEGTMTFLPRHTILYLPFSLLSGRQDRLSMVLHLDSSPPGNGHIVDAHQHRAGWFPIDGEEEMERSFSTKNGREFMVLAYNPLVTKRLTEVLDAMPDTSSLRHFGYSGSDSTVVIELQPRESTLRAAVEYLSSFIVRFAREPL